MRRVTSDSLCSEKSGGLANAATRISCAASCKLKYPLNSDGKRKNECTGD